MKNEISKVLPGSIAEELELEEGDRLLTINDTPVKDIIDYRFMMADEYVVIDVEKKDGEVWTLEIEKDYNEELGVEFREAILDTAISCTNKCIFCFIDQLPGGMRDTLYFKDDDSRLSFLQGNFVTLTNMSDEDIDRIIRYRISPINVSVHTTDPELRKQMLNNRFAGTINERMKRLADAGIKMNCQIVLCPGINNGEELNKTVEDLFGLYPSVENIAVVPIGVTAFRKGLHKLEIYNKESAAKEIDNIKLLQEKYLNKIGSPFVRLADEFYIMAGRDVPDSNFYGEFEQLEDGIGMIRLIRDVIEETLPELKDNISGKFTIITGSSAYDEIHSLCEKIMNKNSKIKINAVKIINRFFGETITVAGLITGKDIIEQLSQEEVGDYILLPRNMLKKGYELGPDNEKIFLDDITTHDIEKRLSKKVIVCEYTGEDLIKMINEAGREE